MRSHICNFWSTKAALSCFNPTPLLFTCCLTLALSGEMHSSSHVKPCTWRLKDAGNWKSWHYQWCIKSNNLEICRHMAAAFTHSPPKCSDSVVQPCKGAQRDWRAAGMDENAADIRNHSADRWSNENRAGADRYLPPARASRTHEHTRFVVDSWVLSWFIDTFVPFGRHFERERERRDENKSSSRVAALVFQN